MRRLLFLALIACAGRPQTGTGSPAGHGPPTGLRVRDVLVADALGYDVAISADGRRAAAVILDTEFRLLWIELPSGRVVSRVPLGDPAYDCADVDVSGELAAVACRDGRVRLFRADQLVHELRLDGAATAVRFSADGAFFATGSSTGVLCLRRTRDAALLQCVSEHLGEVSALALDGDVLVSGAHDGTVATWELPSLRLIRRWRVTGAVTAVAGAHVGSAPTPPRLPARGPGWLDDVAVPHAPSSLAVVGSHLVITTWEPSLALAGGPALHDFVHILRAVAASRDGRTLLVAGFGPARGGPAITRIDVLYAP